MNRRRQWDHAPEQAVEQRRQAVGGRDRADSRDDDQHVALALDEGELRDGRRGHEHVVEPGPQRAVRDVVADEGHDGDRGPQAELADELHRAAVGHRGAGEGQRQDRQRPGAEHGEREHVGRHEQVAEEAGRHDREHGARQEDSAPLGLLLTRRLE